MFTIDASFFYDRVSSTKYFWTTLVKLSKINKEFNLRPVMEIDRSSSKLIFKERKNIFALYFKHMNGIPYDHDEVMIDIESLRGAVEVKQINGFLLGRPKCKLKSMPYGGAKANIVQKIKYKKAIDSEYTDDWIIDSRNNLAYRGLDAPNKWEIHDNEMSRDLINTSGATQLKEAKLLSLGTGDLVSLEFDKFTLYLHLKNFSFGCRQYPCGEWSANKKLIFYKDNYGDLALISSSIKVDQSEISGSSNGTTDRLMKSSDNSLKKWRLKRNNELF